MNNPYAQDRLARRLAKLFGRPERYRAGPDCPDPSDSPDPCLADERPDDGASGEASR